MDRRSRATRQAQRDRRLLPFAVCLLALHAPVAGREGDPPSIRPGERAEFELSDADVREGLGAARELAVLPAADGPLTVLVESFDGDVLARVLESSGATRAQSGDGGFPGRARLVLEFAEAGRPVPLLAAFRTALAGRLTIEVKAGIVPLPEGAALALERGRFLSARGQLRLARGDDGGGLTDLKDAGELLFGLGRFAAAREAWSAAAPRFEERGDALRAAFARGFEACAAYRQGRPAEALPLLEVALPSARASGSPQLECMVASDLGQACRDLGRSEEAAVHLSRALDLARQAGSGPFEVILLAQRARLELDRGRPGTALDTLAEAEHIPAAREPGLPRLELLATRAACLQVLGDPRGARELLVQALALPATPTRLANLLGELADATLAAGDILAAASLYRDVASDAADLDDTSLLATATLGLGETRLQMGDLAAAREAFESALVTWGDDGRAQNRAAALLKLAELEGEAHDGAAARRQIARLEQLAADVGGETLASLALAAAGQLAYAERDFEGALRAAERRAELWRDTGATLQLALAVRDVAQATLRVGRPRDALQLALVALQDLRALHRTRATLHPLCTLVEAELALGDTEAAARWLGDAMDAQRASATDVHGRLDPELLAVLRTNELDHTPSQLVHDVTARRVRRAEKGSVEREHEIDAGLLACGQWKGLELAEGLSLRSSAGGAERLARIAERDSLMAERDLAQAELLRATAAGSPEAEVAVLRGGLARLAASVKLLDDALSGEQASEPAAGDEPRSDLATLRSALGPDALYVEYAESMERLYAYAVGPTRADLLDLGPLHERAAQIERFVAGVSDPAALSDAATLARDGRALHAALLEPALALADAPDARLHVVPCAAVAALPFEALVVQAPDAPKGFADLIYEIDRREVAYAPSGPVFIQLQRMAPRATPGRALVLGDPVYPPAEGATPRGSRDPRNLGFVRLPGTRDEALALAARLLDADQDGSAPASEALALARELVDTRLDDGALRLLLGGAADAGALRGDLREFALIHCAAHGHVDPHDPRLTGLALTPAGDDDGFVTLGDVAELSLDADLAVLSACETGRGGERRGEGTQSLARAFLQAGARGVVASLWQVDDRETERTMEAFYAGLTDRGLTAGAALREARLAIRHAPAAPDAFRGTGRGKLLAGAQAPEAAAGRKDLAGHPYFWAAFTYTGPSGLKPLAPR